MDILLHLLERMEKKIRHFFLIISALLFFSGASILYLLPYPDAMAPVGIFFLCVLFFDILAYLLIQKNIRDIKQSAKKKEKAIRDAFHDVRTPLSVIKTSSEIALLGGRSDPKEAEHTLQKSAAEVDKITARIEQFYRENMS